MKWVVSKCGAYTSHLASLSKDRSARPADRTKLKGYYSKWTNAKYLLGCALSVNLLTPCTTFSKVHAEWWKWTSWEHSMLFWKLWGRPTSLHQSLWASGRHMLPLLQSVPVKEKTLSTSCRSSRGIPRHSAITHPSTRSAAVLWVSTTSPGCLGLTSFTSHHTLAQQGCKAAPLLCMLIYGKSTLFDHFYLLIQTCLGLQTWRFYFLPWGLLMLKKQIASAFRKFWVGFIWNYEYVPLRKRTIWQPLKG